jgi:hypothetical protein
VFLVMALAAWPAPSPAERAPRFDQPLAYAPLDTPLVVTGGFGEYRIGHFHAGFDLGTGKSVGKPVRAPLSGHVERVRASGVGYGRSLYVRSRDGRLLQLGHLDAFAEPVASWVDSVQRATGQYEQDLWPEASRFPVRAGQRIAWTGQSGAGGPHLHFEIRRGDMAYHPSRAGLTVRDTRAPSLTGLTLEPLDDTSRVRGRVAPFTMKLAAAPETVLALGRLRAVVGARDGVWSGVDRMVPWLTRLEWGGDWVEARFDSISWATDMSEGDYCYDAGRVTGDRGLVLWAPAGWRPRVLHASAPRDREAGTLVVRANDPPRTLRLIAQDAAGNARVRSVVIRPPVTNVPAAAAAGAGRGGGPAGRTCECDCLEVTSLPGRKLRIAARRPAKGADPRVGLLVDGIPHLADSASRTVIVTVPEVAREIAALAAFPGDSCGNVRGPSYEPIAPGAAGLGRRSLAPFDVSNELRARRWTWELPADAVFDDELLFASEPREELRPPVSSELILVQHLGGILPRSVPLRRPIVLHVPRLPYAGHTGLFRHGPDGWDWVRTTERIDGLGWDAETSRTGWFAILADTLPPRLGVATPRGSSTGPYSRWSLETSVSENGSGVDPRGCNYTVDGERVAVEWDPEASVLRWRPLVPPDPGTHDITILAADRAGNQRVLTAVFRKK